LPNRLQNYTSPQKQQWIVHFWSNQLLISSQSSQIPLSISRPNFRSFVYGAFKSLSTSKKSTPQILAKSSSNVDHSMQTDVNSSFLKQSTLHLCPIVPNSSFNIPAKLPSFCLWGFQTSLDHQKSWPPKSLPNRLQNYTSPQKQQWIVHFWSNQLLISSQSSQIPLSISRPNRHRFVYGAFRSLLASKKLTPQILAQSFFNVDHSMQTTVNSSFFKLPILDLCPISSNLSFKFLQKCRCLVSQWLNSSKTDFFMSASKDTSLSFCSLPQTPNSRSLLSRPKFVFKVPRPVMSKCLFAP
jgi:hypothetical protein